MHRLYLQLLAHFPSLNTCQLKIGLMQRAILAVWARPKSPSVLQLMSKNAAAVMKRSLSELQKKLLIFRSMLELLSPPMERSDAKTIFIIIAAILMDLILNALSIVSFETGLTKPVFLRSGGLLNMRVGAMQPMITLRARMFHQLQ